MRRAILWVLTSLAVIAPIGAMVVRVHDGRATSRLLAEGLSLIDAPIERGVDPPTTDLVRAQGIFERAWRGDTASDEGRAARALWHVAQATLDLDRGELVLAHEEADTAAHLVPGEPHARLIEARLALRRGDRASAETQLRALAARGARSVPPGVTSRAMLLRVDLLLDTERADDALALAEALDRDHPLVASVKNRLGLARAAVGDRAGAREAYERAVSLDPRHDPAMVNLARMSRERGDLAGARTLLERSLAVAPDSPEVWLAYGVVLGDLHADTARHALVRAGELAPDDPAAWVAQGDLDLADGNIEGAAESFRQALARDENHATARTNMGVALARLGRRDAARSAFEEATRRAPHQGEAWNGLGAMRLAAGDADGAIGPLEQASALLPGDPNPSLNLGRAFERLQRFDDAVRAFREALRRAPDNATAAEHLGRLAPAPLRARTPARQRHLARI
ncbi:MAG: tetratricopeptide repeat protein [Deltaproteobacteria bacterium]